MKVIIIICLVGLITFSNSAVAQQHELQITKDPEQNTRQAGTRFGAALADIQSYAKGYVNDSTGEMYCGISRKNFPTWDGWVVIDKYKMKYNDELPELNQLVENFYKHIWSKLHCDQIKNNQYAIQIFEKAIASGLTPTIKNIQEGAGLPITGRMDNATVKALNDPSIGYY